jgi:hypothetical protein
MKKLMLTTAIASVLTTAAIAQTTITGELRVNYKSVEADKGFSTLRSISTANTVGGTQTLDALGAVTPNTASGFGAEQQINIQTKGKANILGGLDYAAGFSIENDGEQGTTIFNENVYMDFTNASSGTTISFSRDHIQRSDSDFSATNLVGFNQAEFSAMPITSNSTTQGATFFGSTPGAGPGQNFGAAILQKTPVGTFSYNYVPNNGAITATDSALGNSEYVQDQTTAAYEAGFLGNLGVNGLTVHYFQNANADFTNRFRSVKAEGKNMGAKYNFGSFTVAANKKLSQAESFAKGTSGAVGEITEKAYSVAYAVNKDLSVGVLVADAKRDYANDPTTGAGSDLVDGRGKQKLKAINVGYALGPVNLAVGYAKNEDVVGTAGSDTDVFMARLIGAF